MTDIMTSDPPNSAVRMLVGLPDDLHAWLRDRSYHDGVSMAEIVRQALRQYRERRDPQMGLPFEERKE